MREQTLVSSMLEWGKMQIMLQNYPDGCRSLSMLRSFTDSTLLPLIHRYEYKDKLKSAKNELDKVDLSDASAVKVRFVLSDPKVNL